MLHTSAGFLASGSLVEEVLKVVVHLHRLSDVLVHIAVHVLERVKCQEDGGLRRVLQCQDVSTERAVCRLEVASQKI